MLAGHDGPGIHTFRARPCRLGDKEESQGQHEHEEGGKDLSGSHR